MLRTILGAILGYVGVAIFTMITLSAGVRADGAGGVVQARRLGALDGHGCW